jgi:hypothetical protein
MSAHGTAPRPSIWPVALALGISIACAGVVTHWVIVVGGAVLAIWAIAAWVVDAVQGGA